MGEMTDATGKPVPGSTATGGAAGSSSYGKAVEETAASKARKKASAWSSAYFKHLGVGSGLGGAAAIEKYKTSNPGWEKKRDAWAQGLAAKKPAPAPGASLASISR